MGTDSDSYADEMLKWARDGEMSVVELTPLRFGAWAARSSHCLMRSYSA